MAPRETLKHKTLAITVSFDTTDKVTEGLILNLIQENKLELKNTSYQHKTKQYISLTTEPHLPYDYKTVYEITGDSNHLKFLKYILNTRLQQILQLEGNLKEEKCN